MKTIEYENEKDLKEKLRKMRVDRFQGDYLRTYIIYMLVSFVAGCVAWYFQSKINGWC